MQRSHLISALAFGAVALAAILAAPTATAQSSGYSFVPLVPCRVVDTRGPSSTNGGPALDAGATRTFQIKGQCGVPATAKAVALTLTAVGPTAAGHLILWPAGVATPGTSNINFVANQPAIANFAILALATSPADLSVVYGTAGQVATVHVLIDVQGYYD